MSRVFSTALVVVIALAPSLLTAAPKKKNETPALPAPDVNLRLEPRAPGKLWRVEVLNAGTVPLTLVADERLLRLTIVPPTPTTSVTTKKTPKPPAPTECQLPASMRTADRTLALAPGERWTAEIDPRLFCLDRIDKLVAGATVQARLGWAPPKTGTLVAPFVVAPASSSASEIAAAKEIAAPPVALDTSTAASPTTTTSTTSTKAPIVASGGSARSVSFGIDADVSVVVKNASSSAHTVYARPQLVDARVLTPRGQPVTCAGPLMQPAPLLDFSTRLSPNATWSATVPLSTLCPPATFDVPGLYLITPVVHLLPMPQLKGEWSGDVVADTPALLRVELGKQPFFDAPPAVAK